jgi:hypothetical protein
MTTIKKYDDGSEFTTTDMCVGYAIGAIGTVVVLKTLSKCKNWFTNRPSKNAPWPAPKAIDRV